MAERTLAAEISDQIRSAICELPQGSGGPYEKGFALLNANSLPRTSRTAVALGLIESDISITSLCIVDRSQFATCQQDVEMWIGLIYPGFRAEPRLKYSASPFIGMALTEPLTLVRYGIDGLPRNLKVDPKVVNRVAGIANNLRNNYRETHTLFKFVADEIARGNATRGWG